jgi:hypothetical protein
VVPTDEEMEIATQTYALVAEGTARENHRAAGADGSRQEHA